MNFCVESFSQKNCFGKRIKASLSDNASGLHMFVLIFSQFTTGL